MPPAISPQSVSSRYDSPWTEKYPSVLLLECTHHETKWMCRRTSRNMKKLRISVCDDGVRIHVSHPFFANKRIRPLCADTVPQKDSQQPQANLMKSLLHRVHPSRSIILRMVLHADLRAPNARVQKFSTAKLAHPISLGFAHRESSMC